MKNIIAPFLEQEILKTKLMAIVSGKGTFQDSRVVCISIYSAECFYFFLPNAAQYNFKLRDVMNLCMLGNILKDNEKLAF